jgi:ABC-type multidrug transport system fused ATPase/permease subunit
MATDKKPFSETKFAQFLERAKPVMGKVLEGVGAVTGKDVFTNVGKLLNDHTAETPEQAAIIAEFNQEQANYELELQKLEFETFKAEVADRDSARNREIQYLQASGGKRDWIFGTVVLVALTMYILAFLFLAYGPAVAAEKKDLFNMAVGQVLTFAGMAFSYYLGTTRNSMKKNEIIANATHQSK